MQHAHLVRPDLGDIIGTLSCQLSDDLEIARAFPMAHPGPGAVIECLARRTDCLPQVRLLPSGDADKNLLRGRCDHIDASARTRRHPFAIDKQTIRVPKGCTVWFRPYVHHSQTPRSVDRYQNLNVSSPPN